MTWAHTGTYIPTAPAMPITLQLWVSPNKPRAPRARWRHMDGPCSPGHLASGTQPPLRSALGGKAIYLNCPGMNFPMHLLS